MAGAQPKQIGRYKVQEELGRGGFGRVYRAYDPTVSRPVAIKILTEVSADTQTRFRNEATVAGNLRHKNIVTVYEYGSYEGLPFLAMEYLEGEDLHNIIASRKPLSLLEKCAIMSQVADGLSYAHNNGVVHRDMKPANIMVLRDGAVKIMDFGIARLTRKPDATRLTQQGYLIGTLRYMAPEQLAGTDFDPQCDIFAYGVIFYEFLTGRHPFEAADAQRLMYKLSFEEPVPIRQHAPGLPDALQHAISQMIQKDRDQRYRTMKDLQFDTEPVRLELQRGRASELLQQAQELFEQKQLEPARTVLQEALALEPSNRPARALWDVLQGQIQERNLRPRIEAALSAGEEHMAKRRFVEAAQALESALQLDRDNTYIQGRLEQARALVEHAKRASQLLAQARRHFEQQNLTAAYRVVSEALIHDPKNPDAAEFLKTIQEYIERRQEEQRIDEAIRKAEGLMLIPAYDDAMAVLQAADPSSPKIRECLDRLHGQRAAYERQQRLHSEIAEATNLLREQRLDEAGKRLEALRTEFPDNEEVRQLLAYSQKEQAALARTKTIETAAAEARARAASHDFEGALAALGEGLKEYPGDSTLVRLLGRTMTAKSDWEHRCGVELTLARCDSLRAEQRLAEAVQIAKRAIEELGSEPVLLELLNKLETELTGQRRNETIRKLVADAERLLSEKQLEAAVDAVEQALVRFPDAAALTNLLKRARDAVRMQEESQAAERAAAIDQCGREASARAGTGDLEGALALLSEGLRKWPDAGRLHELRKSTLAARDRQEKRRRALQDLEEVLHLAMQESGTPASADLLALAAAIASDHPNDNEIQAAAAEPVKLLTDIGRARQHLTDGNFASALDLCRAAMEQYPQHPAFVEFRRDAERGQRRAFIAELHRRAGAEADLHERARMFERGLELYPDEISIADQLRFTRNKLALVDGIVEQARVLEQGGQWDLALEKWNSLLAVYDKYPGLQGAIERVRQGRENETREIAGRPGEPDAQTRSKTVVLENRHTELVNPPQLGIPAATQPKPTERAGKRSPAPIAAGVTAVIFAAGVVAFRSQRARDVPAAVSTNSPSAAVASAAPATAPSAANLALPPSRPEAPKPTSEKPTSEKGTAAPSARMARLEIAGAVPGAQVKLDGRPLGETDANGALQHDVEPGTHTIELSKEDYAAAVAREHFRVNKSVRLERERVAMARLAKPAPPPDPKQVDAQEWVQVANSTNPDELDAFIRNHPASAHLDQARARAADLRQQIHARAAQQMELSTWEKVDQNSREQLQDYLTRFPSGAHAPQSRIRIAEIDRQAAEALANQRAKEQKDLEQAKHAADVQAVSKLLAEFNAAFSQRDLAALQRLWAGVPVDKYRQQFKEAKELSFQLQLVSQPEVIGNTATAICMRTFHFRGQAGGVQNLTERVKLNLTRDGSGWLIRSILSY